MALVSVTKGLSLGGPSNGLDSEALNQGAQCSRRNTYQQLTCLRGSIATGLASSDLQINI